MLSEAIRFLQTKACSPLSLRIGAGGEVFLLFILFLASCSSDSEKYNPYHDWQARNAAWYEQIADSARTAIHAAQARYGNQWQEHCDWRMLKSFTKSAESQSGVTADSVCVHILSRGTGTQSPAYTDSVRISFRGMLMPTTDKAGRPMEVVVAQTYYGTYDPATAVPNLSPVSAYRPGMATALQYMVEGDDWLVYIPQQLFYGSTANEVIPAYSSVRFRVQMAAVYPLGTKIPEWY